VIHYNLPSSRGICGACENQIPVFAGVDYVTGGFKHQKGEAGR